MRNWLLSTFLALTLVLTPSCKVRKAPKRPTDSQIRASVVKLDSKMGSCSGTQIEAPSGKKYILSAAHCAVLATDGVIHVSTEDAGSYFSKVIEEDQTSDLLLLEPAPGVPAIKIAQDISRHEHLRSHTHGRGYPTYSTDGIYIGEDVIQFEAYWIDTPEQEAACNKPKNKIEEVSFFGVLTMKVCTVKVIESVTTVKAVPGSSGGLVANDDGELAGVVSTGDEAFTNLVTLKDIHHFLEKR